MTTSANALCQLGIATQAANKLGNTIATIAGVGTSQTGAKSVKINAALLTTSGGQTAFVLDTEWEVGDEVTLTNTSATAALIFPQSGGNINGGSTNASISLAQNASVTLRKDSATAWHGVASAAPSDSPTFTDLTVSDDLAVGGDAAVTGTLEVTGASTLTGQVSAPAGLNTKQSVANVHDTTPTAAELTAAFGAPATLGRGFVATVDDNDGDTNGYIVWTSDASWYFLKGTKAL